MQVSDKSIVDIFRGQDKRSAFIALSMARVRMNLLYSSFSTSLYTRTRSMYPRHISPRSSSCFARSDVKVTSHRSSSLLVPLMTLRGTYCTVRTKLPLGSEERRSRTRPMIRECSDRYVHGTRKQTVSGSTADGIDEKRGSWLTASPTRHFRGFLVCFRCFLQSQRRPTIDRRITNTVF